MRSNNHLWYFILALCWGKSLSTPQQLVNELKTTMLPLFGFKDRPKIDPAKVQVPETLKKLYQIQNDLDWDTTALPLPGLYTGSANTVRSFTHVESPVDKKFPKHHKFRLFFDTSSIPKHETLKAAEVKLTREVVAADGDGFHQRILVNDIIKRGVKGVRPPIIRVIDSKLIDIRKNGTISVDVFPAVERWLQDPASNHGILIAVYSAGRRNKTPPRKHLRLKRDLGDDYWARHQPLLLTYTDDGKGSRRTGVDLTRMRSKRGARKGQRKNERDPCKRRQMTVNFADVGWSDWIVAPLGFNAYYCAGECEYPMPDHLNTTNHAIVQSLMNSARPAEVPKPCCVPTQLSSISMLYVDSQNNVILKNYKEMVVNGCGCR